MPKTFRPTFRARCLAEVDLKAIYNRGVRVVMLDMDNTLSHWGKHALAPGANEFVDQIKELGMVPVVFSNNSKHRVETFAKKMGIQHAVGRAGKPSKAAFVRAAKKMGVGVEQCAAIGDQLMTDIIGANRAHYAVSVLVHPLSKRELLFTKINRFFERIILKITGQAVYP